MSTREAIERGPLDRPRKMLDWTEAYTDRENPYLAIALKEGTKVLEEAGVPGILQDMADTIRADHPDVKVGEPEVQNPDFSTAMDLRWNFRDMTENGRKDPVCDNLRVIAHPFTAVLKVSSAIHELIEKDQWNGHPEVVEDAVVAAYRNPIRFHTTPVRI